MRTKLIQCILSFLALLGTVHGGVSPIAECTAQAWVRAPDLAPDTIVRGDARVKISAGCPAVETVLLGLRLKERSFVKALRSQEDRKWMRPARVNVQRTSPWDFPLSRFSNHSDEITFHEMLANKDLWLVREEERLVFETTQVIHVTEGASGDCDVVQDFAVLVPSTNMPPALDHLSSIYAIGDATEMANVEFMYEYFVRVPFANGTTKEISAGITGFQPLYYSADTSRRSGPETTELKSRYIGVPGKDSPVMSYTAQVSGLVFTQGSEDQVATVVITRTGPARTFTAPLTVRGCVEPTLSSRWAVEYDMPSSEPMHRPSYVLRSTVKDVEEAKRSRWKRCFGGGDAAVSVTMPNSTFDEIQARDIVTTSATVTIPIVIDRRQITNFETYYETLANSLSIRLETPRTVDEGVDPDHPSAEQLPTWGPEFADDEEPWVPWVKTQILEMPRPKLWGTYSGSVPVIVRPMGEAMPPRRCLHAGPDMSGQVVLSGETGCEQRSLIHYLDEGARGPTFVDRSAIHELLDEDPAERGLRAPILEPVVSSPPEGEELIHRYHAYPRKPLIYVGETWVKKVANKDEHKATSAGPGPIVNQRIEADSTVHTLLKDSMVVSC